ncbi:hypothetical protein M4L39_14140 [Staphylococcus equorum]|uniref:Smooth muscle caldesmon n=1 Tax=Staphylococcus equorum TaxID=246432 RepID=A0A9X4LC33_9STAP|nr:hypothetical protein [Staphylococcus equorum]MDG0844547.1 hypothetical protein [Staphylococcus equorum]MDG0860780.1 hypothetical protein [Staphylococcus equorum]
MKYYNRDNYERNVESYEVPEYFTRGARNEFVYGFLIGAFIGSAVGLISISKSRTKAESQVDSEDESRFKSSIIEQSDSEQADAEQQVDGIKSTIADAQNKNAEATNSELAAQKAAIHQETSDNNLADTSPQAQDLQDDNKLNQSDDTTTHIDADSEPTEDEVNAQQNAIKEEAADNNLADSTTTSSNNKGAQTAAAATGGAIAAGSLAKVAHDKKQSLNDDSQVAENTDNLLKSEETTNGDTQKDAPNLVTKNSKEDESKNNSHLKAGAIAGTVTASGLALAAKNKNKALNDDNKVAENTASLLKPESPKQNIQKDVPNLVTPKVDHAVESTDKVDNSADKNNDTIAQPEKAEQRVKQTHKTVSFKDGIIIHNEAETGISNQTASQAQQNEGTTNATEKTSSFKDGILVHDEVETDKTSESADNSDTQQSKNEYNEPTYSKNRSQLKKSEKAQSKIDKRTFND